MTQPLRVGIKLSQDAPIESYRAIWKIADEARFDHCWAMDHLATIGGIGDDRPIFDGWECWRRWRRRPLMSAWGCS